MYEKRDRVKKALYLICPVTCTCESQPGLHESHKRKLLALLDREYRGDDVGALWTAQEMLLESDGGVPFRIKVRDARAMLKSGEIGWLRCYGGQALLGLLSVLLFLLAPVAGGRS